MEPLKGGRGKKSPWDGQQDKIIRCPAPIAEEVRQFIADWKTEQLTGESPNTEELVTGFSAAVLIAKKVLKQKKSARVSIEKLLSEMYRRNVDLK